MRQIVLDPACARGPSHWAAAVSYPSVAGVRHSRPRTRCPLLPEWLASNRPSPSGILLARGGWDRVLSLHVSSNPRATCRLHQWRRVGGRHCCLLEPSCIASSRLRASWWWCRPQAIGRARSRLQDLPYLAAAAHLDDGLVPIATRGRNKPSGRVGPLSKAESQILPAEMRGDISGGFSSHSLRTCSRLRPQRRLRWVMMVMALDEYAVR